jgi:hypothetical protein
MLPVYPNLRFRFEDLDDDRRRRRHRLIHYPFLPLETNNAHYRCRRSLIHLHINPLFLVESHDKIVILAQLELEACIV